MSLCLLSHLEHSRNVRPSWILNVYLLISLALDGTRARTLWAIPDNRPLATILIVTVVIKGFLVVLEAKEKRNSLLSAYRHYPPEAISGIYNAWFFWWLNPLFLEGYKKTLNIDQLFRADDKLVPRDEGPGLLSKWRQCKVDRHQAAVTRELH